MDDEGWEYASKFGRPTHLRQHYEDSFRRRRLHNEMVPAVAYDPGDTRLFAKMAMRVRRIKDRDAQASSGRSDLDLDVEAGMAAPMLADIPPRAFVIFDKVQRWELRIYILQGRDIFPAARSGDSWTFARAVFMNRCLESQDDLQRYQLLSVRRPCVEIEVSNKMAKTETLKDAKKNPNFDSPVIRLTDVSLPTQIALAAPITLKLKYVVDRPTQQDQGSDSKDSEDQILFDKHMLETGVLPEHLQAVIGQGIEIRKAQFVAMDHRNLELDWWSKYFASVGDHRRCVGFLERGFERMEVLENPLEEVPHYKGFTDFCDTFEFCKVQRGRKGDPEYTEYMGELKGRLFIYRAPTENEEEQTSTAISVPRQIPAESLIPGVEYYGPTDCTVRVYVVRAFDLASRRRSGKADPYVEVRLGNSAKLKARKRARWDTLKPIFGEFFEFPRVTLPQDKTLRVTVKDRRRITADEEIGSTVIDLENRLLTKWRATVGLPSDFNVAGPYVWRDQKTPMQILQNYCKIHNFPKPRLILPTEDAPMRITLGKEKQSEYEFNLEDLEKASGGHGLPKNPYLGEPHQRIALYILRRLALVPEHVETRPLFSSLNMDSEQGRIQLWVDIFPLKKGPIPPPINITPREPRPFQLRLVVWNVRDAIMESRSFGEKTADLYVKCFLNGFDKGKKTDIHYRSLDGSGSFNWRMLFNFDYDPWEKTVVLKKRRFFWERKREERLEPELVVQLWDNNKFGRDHHMGQIKLNLLRCEEGQLDEDFMENVTKRIRRRVFLCGGRRQLQNQAEDLDRSTKELYFPNYVRKVSLFDQRQTKGWWPVLRGDVGEKGKQVTGKVQLEMDLKTKEAADKDPVGKGRAKPNANPYLPKPDRPMMDKHWFTSRFKGFRRLIWRKSKWWILLLILLALFALIIFIVIWNLPEIIALSRQ